MSSRPLGRQAAEARLEQMLVDYRDSLPMSYRVPLFGSDPLREAINASPDLKNRLVDAVDKGYLTRFSNTAVEDGAAAGYATGSRAMHVPESALRDRNELVFVLGHETQHAISRRGIDYHAQLLVPSIGLIANAAPPPAHDYTVPISKFVEDTRYEEAQAHIGGFNAAVSALNAKGVAPTPANLYTFNPGRMRDFIDVQGAFPNQNYQLKAGLTQSPDGHMAINRGNVDAMKTYYPDKIPGSFGENGLLNYRHKAIMQGWELAHQFERAGMAGLHGDKVGVYTIDFNRLGVNPALLNVPPDGKTVATNPIDSGTIPNFDVIRNRTVPLNTLLDDFPRDAVVDRQTGRAMLAQASAPVVAPSNAQPSTSTTTTTTTTSVPSVRSPDAMQSSLYLQAIDGVRSAGLAGLNREQTFNVAAALALEAQAKGLTSIDHVVAGKHGNVFAIQGQNRDAIDARRADVEIEGAKQRPSQDSLGQLHTALSQQARQPDAPAVQTPHRQTQ